jgi:hypothetical protein
MVDVHVPLNVIIQIYTDRKYANCWRLKLKQVWTFQKVKIVPILFFNKVLILKHLIKTKDVYVTSYTAIRQIPASSECTFRNVSYYERGAI